MTQKDPRLTLQESLELVRVETPRQYDVRYMSTRPAWVPGSDLPWDQLPVQSDATQFHTATYGAHVYAMSAAAILKAVADGQDAPGATNLELGLHVICPSRRSTEGDEALLTSLSPYKAASHPAASRTDPSSSMSAVSLRAAPSPPTPSRRVNRVLPVVLALSQRGPSLAQMRRRASVPQPSQHSSHSRAPRRPSSPSKPPPRRRPMRPSSPPAPAPLGRAAPPSTSTGSPPSSRTRG